MTVSKSTRRAKSAPAPVRDIPLKTVLNAILADDKSRTLTTKQMRVVLRREYAVALEHARNALWTFTADEAVTVRARFDSKFRAKLEKASTRKPRAKKAAPVETVAE